MNPANAQLSCPLPTLAHEPSPRPTPHDGAADFAFLHGSWRVHNRRRARPRATSTGWEEFDGRSTVRPLFDGRGDIEEWEAETPSGRVRAVSLHLYDPAARQWRLHWATEQDGRVGVPTVGSFDNGVGEFYAQEDIDGRSTLLRITWRDRGAEACGWEQSFSSDGGRTWVLDWTMDFTREHHAPPPL